MRERCPAVRFRILRGMHLSRLFKQIYELCRGFQVHAMQQRVSRPSGRDRVLRGCSIHLPMYRLPGFFRFAGPCGEASSQRAFGRESEFAGEESYMRPGPKTIDLEGRRFGRLTIGPMAFKRRGTAYWNCNCDCGGKVIVNGNSLRGKKTRSCGCYRSEIQRERHRIRRLGMETR